MAFLMTLATRLCLATMLNGHFLHQTIYIRKTVMFQFFLQHYIDPKSMMKILNIILRIGTIDYR